MKAVILAGGLGTRISEETAVRPKPMIEIGGKPVLWHILKTYSHHGINDFVICLGYRGYIIKEYFANYFLHTSDVTFDLSNNKLEVHQKHAEPWRITLVDTGEHTQTGGRLKRVANYLDGDTSVSPTAMVFPDLDIRQELAFHKSNKTLATMCAVQPPGRFGAIDIKGNRITRFEEKPSGDGSWINGGILYSRAWRTSYIDGDDCVWERGPLENLAKDGQLSAFSHNGFWQPMDTLRDKIKLEELWQAKARRRGRYGLE